jgi:hypothetical protein
MMESLMKNLLVILMSVLSLLLITTCHANAAPQGAPVAPETSDSAPIKYDVPSTEVHWELTADGSDWERLYASGEADLKFGDSRDIRIAKKNAVLRAKAEIAKFFKEKISTEETLEDITKASMKATATDKGVSEEATRNVVSTTIEKIVNQADAVLSGLVTLEEVVDSNAKTVRVTVGISKNSIRIANSVSQSIKDGGATPPNTTTPAAQGSSKTTRSPMYNKF